MIMTVAELKQYISTTESDSVLEVKLQALENMIRSYTHNNFQNRSFRFNSDVDSTGILATSPLFAVGDTIEISNSKYNAGLYVIESIDTTKIVLNRKLFEEDNVLITKITYPEDVKLGAVNMIKWDLENRDKVGIQSESISRHSVTYFNMDGDNSTLGYPKSLVGFLKPHMKARF